jgi:hypothetical protein
VIFFAENFFKEGLKMKNLISRIPAFFGIILLAFIGCEAPDSHTHDWDEWVEILAATETQDGEEIRTCKLDPSHVETRTFLFYTVMATTLQDGVDTTSLTFTLYNVKGENGMVWPYNVTLSGAATTRMSSEFHFISLKNGNSTWRFYPIEPKRAGIATVKITQPGYDPKPKKIIICKKGQIVSQEDWDEYNEGK